jgi:hypothetical protein
MKLLEKELKMRHGMGAINREKIRVILKKRM